MSWRSINLTLTAKTGRQGQSLLWAELSSFTVYAETAYHTPGGP